jgi:Membrane carboxypeptidase/penicillin-binding protein
LGYISEEDYKKAIKAPLDIVKRNNPNSGYLAPYFFDFVLKDLIKRFGKDMVYEGGLKVYTTIDTKMQDMAEKALLKIINEYGKKYNVKPRSFALLRSQYRIYQSVGRWIKL